MSDKTNDNELSLDELKDVSGGLTQSIKKDPGTWVRNKDEITNTLAFEDRVISVGDDDDGNDFVRKI